uniref:ABC transporter permease n=1 Tax=Mitsuokella jalaludinii TaxID=187979 RepID=UPI00307BEFB7
TLLIFMVSTTGLGLSISSAAKNMQQVLVYLLVLMVPMVLLSGLVTPIHNMPAFLQAVTYANPMRFVIDAVRRIYLEGAGLCDIAWDFVPMLAVAAVTMPLAGWLFRHKTT